MSDRRSHAQQLGTEARWRHELALLQPDHLLQELFWDYVRRRSGQLARVRATIYTLLDFLAFQRARGWGWRVVDQSLLEQFLDAAEGLQFNALFLREHTVRSWAILLQQRQLLESVPESVLRNRNSRQNLKPLTYAEICLLMSLPDLSSPWGLRDRTILEVAYATGMRPFEQQNLDLADVDLQGAVVLIRQAKNRVQRQVPLNRSAVHFLQRYLAEVRADVASCASGQALWLSRFGRRLSFVSFRQHRLQALYKLSEVFGRPVGLYHLRHSLARHLLSNGAELRKVQQWLGHERLSSTQHYLHQQTSELRAVLLRCHPRASSDWP